MVLLVSYLVINVVFDLVLFKERQFSSLESNPFAAS